MAFICKRSFNRECDACGYCIPDYDQLTDRDLEHEIRFNPIGYAEPNEREELQ